MIDYARNVRILAMGFAALAGYIDAVGFLKSGGLFVSFMSGNSTRLAVGLGEQSWSVVAMLVALIFLFVFGVFANVLIGMIVTSLPRKVVAAAGVSIVLLCAAMAQSAGANIVCIGLLCVAMGASNAIFQRDGDVTVGVTYMTGTLVKLGYQLAAAARGAGGEAWLPYLLHWIALVIGGIGGTLMFMSAPTFGLWGAVGWSLLLLVACHRIAGKSGAGSQ